MTATPDISAYREMTLTWGRDNIRSFPWRYAGAYEVLVSEFMLHRTQVFQVLPVYTSFIQKYPDLDQFSHANPSEVRDEVKSLGLGWRIDGMIRALSTLWADYQAVPGDFEKLRAIQGIGPYIAGAVIVFSQNKPLPLIDTNIVRVTGRVFGLDLRGEARRRKSVVEAITCIVDPDNPRDYYYSIIDIAHTICRIKDPQCELCPFRKTCIWLSSTKLSRTP